MMSLVRSPMHRDIDMYSVLSGSTFGRINVDQSFWVPVSSASQTQEILDNYKSKMVKKS